MSNLEHLIENGLCLLEKDITHNQWHSKMIEDINYCECNISIDDLWEICQYVKYTYLQDEKDKMCADCDWRDWC